MGTRGYIAYRYKGKYYLRYLTCDAYPSGHGQEFANKVPREPSAFNEWVADTTKMLENANTSDEEVLQPHLSDSDSPEDDDHLGYELCEDSNWTFTEGEYTYVIDLDNRVFTINGGTHLKLDNMPPEEYFDEDGISVPPQYLSTTVNLWPAPAFDTKKCIERYEALCSIVTPTTEWGTPSWDELSFSQRFSVDLTHHLLTKTSSKMAFAYASIFRDDVGLFCWNILCAATTSVPLCCDTISTGGWYNHISISSPFRVYFMLYHTGAKYFQWSSTYGWVRNCLIAFCFRLNDPALVAYEVHRMVHKMRKDGDAECTGIILSSQQEILFVAVDGGLGETCQVRHTPVLNIQPCPGKPGEASEGLLLMVQLLSPILTVPQLPWRTSRSHPSSFAWLWPKLPLEIFQQIIHYTSTPDYVSLCRVSRSIRSACLASPRFSDYTLLYKLPGHNLNYIAQLACDGLGTYTKLSIFWDSSARDPDWRWNASLVYEDKPDAGQSSNERETGNRAIGC